ncbi:DUF1003 domain-containing protein [Kitasatospora kifunensis]|uniref:Putative membrane protein n=1 Tax=Kitasatospora kifunensis TaxID=58351 RepID=A0A7W7VZB4_KITKI|nr:DUF1003 domain-containing protein [Kitasatospora kifunensis]MBB4927510.1 putative membrane protein [Kitasatospora kifunensis]
MSSASQPSDLRDLPGPVTVDDEQIGVNGAIAAALTRWVGSMPALYTALVIVGGWMALATWGPLHQADPYPFPFLLFLDNVVQLILCLVILVGQRVLGAAADRRAVQTYENAEAIFEQVADLQGHLDRHDRALSRGVSLLEATPHPWIQRHRVQPPPQAIDHAVTLNGRIAAWLTQRLGTVWAFYLAAGTQVVWIVMAQLGLQRFDPYPFAFMSFLSTLAQLIFMIVIMVGQDVLSRAADRRSEQTYLDAEAILHECGRMKARLTAQDRVIDSLTGYTTTQVTEQLARAIHETGAQLGDGHGQLPPVPWEELPEELKEADRAEARQIGERLAAIGCLMVPTFNPAHSFVFEDEEVRQLARLEHESGLAGQTMGGVEHGLDEADRTQGYQVPWEQLSEEGRARGMEAVRRIPAVLARAGFQVLRDGGGAQDGPQEADFTADEWDTLQRALMASGVLVALAEGVIDAEEMFALVKKLRETSITHPQRFIRELTAASTFDTGVPTGMRYAEYQGPALEVIRSATAIVARIAPAQLADFRTLLAEIAATVGDANKEGGFFGLGAQRRYGNEATAMAAVGRAIGLGDA